MSEKAMTPTPTHTPTPWRVAPSMTRFSSSFSLTGENEWIVVDSDNKRVLAVDHAPIKINASFIVTACNSHSALLEVMEAAKAQHKAIDHLFALLIEKVPRFFPSQSGQPWEACVRGNAAISQAEKALKGEINHV